MENMPKAMPQDFYNRFFGYADSAELAQRSPAWLQALAQSQYTLWRHWHAAPTNKDKTGVSEHMVLHLLTDAQWPQDRLGLAQATQSQAWEAEFGRAYLQIVHADMPFLVDSLTMVVNHLGYRVHWLVHPVLPVGDEGHEGQHASVILAEIDIPPDAKTQATLLEQVQSAYADVRQAVVDWKPIRTRLLDEAQAIENLMQRTDAAPALTAHSQWGEAVAFLRWLAADHYIFLGALNYELHSGASTIADGNNNSQRQAWRPIPKSALGVVGAHQVRLQADKALYTFTDTYAAGALLLRKSMQKSTVHRASWLDGISVKRFDDQGRWIGITRFWGLYTSKSYQSNPIDIPMIRERVQRVLKDSCINTGGHSYKALENILYTYPRDELLQMDAQTLQRHALAILRLQERQRVLVLLRQDTFGRFASVLVYLPRERYDTDIRKRLGELLLQELGGMSLEFTPMLTDATLARVHFVVRAKEHLPADLDEKKLEEKVSALCQPWEKKVEAHLRNQLGALQEPSARQQFVRLQALVCRFPAVYKAQVSPAQAACDVNALSALTPENPLMVRLHLPEAAGATIARFQLFSISKLTLSQTLPILENMGVCVLDEDNYKIDLDSKGTALWLYELGLDLGDLSGIQESQNQDLSSRFEALFVAVWKKQLESDTLNRLVLNTGLRGEQIAILRAYVRYFRQINLPFGQNYIEGVLCRNATLTEHLFALFEARFNPAQQDSQATTAVESLRQTLQEGLAAVPSLDEDKILRQLEAVVLATLRTNAYLQHDFLSFKLNPRAIPNLPEPKPVYEIWVYAPHFEGVHLRGGKVARGGLRWSDRPEDFRTEILGLMKAQTVKNTVIVPVGAKGGFVLKQAPAPSQREAWLAEGKRCYQDFLRGLLDITDNLVRGIVQAPENVVRHDDDDPYLVVAADKGTATFSDLANSVAESYGFWLGDAFASGGSNGYDHKKMGITARGAWVSAQRHFYGLDKNIQTTPFTVAGIGDMSGDVFGNGMLLSPYIQLVLAFDHRDIFIDPSPEPAQSFAERQRLFALPRSSWQDYDKKLISKGGGVFSRAAKSIPLSAQARALLGVEEQALSPNELLKAILKAPVDMLYNGGIGTYVKASWQNNTEVGDKLGDAYRVDGRQLRCAALVEGGNLGCTQDARIEYSLNQGLIYADAIDNSAGVDCSDYEVNIKILLRLATDQGLLSNDERNQLLASMTDTVATSVLHDNFQQTQQLEINAWQPLYWLEAQSTLMDELESSGLLNRANENLPDQIELEQRQEQGIGLTRPESAVLMAYSKMQIMGHLMTSDLPDDAFYAPLLTDYFPQTLTEKFASLIAQHPLRREIIATRLCNDVVNRMGATCVFFLTRESGLPVHEVVRAYTLATAIFGLQSQWEMLDQQMFRISAKVQMRLLDQMMRTVQRATRLILRHRTTEMPLSDQVAHYQPIAAQLRANFATCVPQTVQTQCQNKAEDWIKDGVDAALAQSLVMLPSLFAALDLADLAQETQLDLFPVAKTYYAVEAAWRLPQWRETITRLPTQTVWQRRARSSATEETYSLAVQTTRSLLQKGENTSTWEAANHTRIEHNQSLLQTLSEQPSELAPVVVGLRAIQV